MRLVIIICFLVVSLVSCIGLGDASTKPVLEVNSFVDPDYRDTSFKKIMIDVPAESFAARKSWENTLVQYFTGFKMKAVESNVMFLPTRQYSAQDSMRVLADSGVDAVLRFKVRLHSYATELCTDGTPMEKPQVAFNWILSDLKNNRTVWIGDGYNGGNVYSTLSGITHTLIMKIMETIVSEGIIDYERSSNNLSK